MAAVSEISNLHCYSSSQCVLEIVASIDSSESRSGRYSGTSAAMMEWKQGASKNVIAVSYRLKERRLMTASCSCRRPFASFQALVERTTHPIIAERIKRLLKNRTDDAVSEIAHYIYGWMIEIPATLQLRAVKFWRKFVEGAFCHLSYVRSEGSFD